MLVRINFRSPNVNLYLFHFFYPPNARCTDDNMMPKAHEKIFEWFNYTKSPFVAGPHYSGNTQGYLYPSEWFDNIVIPSHRCAMDKECIQPEGSSLSNHRYDQTPLSIIIVPIPRHGSTAYRIPRRVESPNRLSSARREAYVDGQER